MIIAGEAMQNALPHQPTTFAQGLGTDLLAGPESNQRTRYTSMCGAFCVPEFDTNQRSKNNIHALRVPFLCAFFHCMCIMSTPVNDITARIIKHFLFAPRHLRRSHSESFPFVWSIGKRCSPFKHMRPHWLVGVVKNNCAKPEALQPGRRNSCASLECLGTRCPVSLWMMRWRALQAEQLNSARNALHEFYRDSPLHTLKCLKNIT